MKKILFFIPVLIFYANSFGNGLEVLEKHGCLDCHSIYKNTEKAPPFIAIRNRYLGQYLGNERKLKMIIRRAVRFGSKGRWLRYKNGMPPVRNISEREINEIANYIINLQPNYFKYYYKYR